jgi:hypothetical protein
MKTFDVKALSGWSPVQPNEVLAFEAAGESRAVRLMVNAVDKVAVYAADNAEMTGAVLVGASDGLFAVAYTATGESFVRFAFSGKAAVFVQGAAPSHVVQATDDEKYTSIIPPDRRSNSEVQRMMHLMRINEKRREEALSGELAELRRERAAMQAAKEAAAAAVVLEPGEKEDEK